MSKKRGWQKIAIARNSGNKINLETLEDYWIIPKKLTLDVYEQIMDKNGLDIDQKLLEGKSQEEIKVIIETSLNSSENKKFSIADEHFKNMVKLAFLNGVHDHNFDKYVDKNNNEVTDDLLESLTEKEFQQKLKDNEIKVIKEEWNEELYLRMRNFMDTLFEIYKIVMEFNSPLASKTSEK